MGDRLPDRAVSAPQILLPPGPGSRSPPYRHGCRHRYRSGVLAFRQKLLDRCWHLSTQQHAPESFVYVGQGETWCIHFIEDAAAESPLDSATVESLREAKALRKLRHPSRSEQLRSSLMED